MRTEKDKLGALELDDNVLYGIQTARAAKNFDLKHKKAQMRLINAIVLVKKAAALTYIKMSIGQDNVYPAIVKACDHILAGDADEAFITEASEQFGNRGARQAQQILEQAAAMFAGGSLTDEDKIAFMDEIQSLYLDSKRRAKKFTPKKYLKNQEEK